MKANIFQILLDEARRSQCDAGFITLDATDSSTGDWGEYHAIRQFLLNHPVSDDEFYGFFGADFRERTALGAADVHAFISDNADAEVLVFSAASREGACYLNVFEQANVMHPGLLEAASLCLRRIGLDVDLQTLVMDARSTVAGYGIVARPSFWNTWFALTEKLYETIESHDAELDATLAKAEQHTPLGTVKQALVQRFAALALAMCPDIQVRSFDASGMPWTKAAMQPFASQVAFLNEIKRDYRRSNNAAFLSNFLKLRGAILKASEGERFRHAEDGFLTTARIDTQDVLYACYTHVELPFEYPSFVMPIYLGESQAEGRTNLRDLAPEWERYHPQLGSLAGCFALKNYLVNSGQQFRRIGMCQYRKFVSTSKIGGVPAPNYPVMDVIGKSILASTDLAVTMLPGGDDLLIGKYGVVSDGYLGQYNAAHHVEDLLRFVSEAVELGVLGAHEVAPFFNATIFIPGGIEMGVFPAAFWLESMTAIERVVLACVKRYPTPREGYQARQWAFCVERLGSYLLLKYIASRYGKIDTEAAFIGQLNLFNSDKSAMYVGSGA
jgi:hypothetical protein